MRYEIVVTEEAEFDLDGAAGRVKRLEDVRQKYETGR